MEKDKMIAEPVLSITHDAALPMGVEQLDPSQVKSIKVRLNVCKPGVLGSETTIVTLIEENAPATGRPNLIAGCALMN
jgi:hypothetical protein